MYELANFAAYAFAPAIIVDFLSAFHHRQQSLAHSRLLNEKPGVWHPKPACMRGVSL
jgi:hypothetical protein